MSDLPVLDAAEQRALGSLLEKEITVPGAYPMTVNAVRGACNQTSSREPVVDYDEELVQQTLRSLKDKDLVTLVWQTGSRVVKYAQTFAQRRGLAPDERALLTVLLLRGPQPAGALRTRTERLHPFTDRTDVEHSLARMAAGETPMVRELPRQPGQHDIRWVHLLGPVELGEATAAGPEQVDRESVLAAGPDARDDKVRTAYAEVAAAYAEQFDDELAGLPFESWLLRRVAELAGGAPVIEVGSGTGHVTAFLAAAGADASALDFTPEMVDEARRRHPGIDYRLGDLRRLMRPVAHDGWGAVLAWYSLIHLAASELPGAIASLVRPLRTGGWLVLAVHAGDGIRTVTDWLGHQVDLDVVLHDRAEVLDVIGRAGLVDIEWYHRGPSRSRNETTERLYLLARKP